MELAFAEYLAHAPVFLRKIDGEIVYWTQGAQELYGFDFAAAVGRNSHDLLNTQFPEPVNDINRRLRDDGVWQGLLRHTRQDGALIWVESRWRLKVDGGQSLVVETNAAVTKRETLARELHHRVKNTLGVVQGLARLTFRPDTQSLKEFEERLAALAAVHSILVQHHWGPAGLIEVFEGALAGLGVRDRVRIIGDDVQLRPNSILAYLLAFHELAVNAIKHGSLSAPEGRVEVKWERHGENLNVVWRESGGPSPRIERNPGSGTMLFEKIISAELGAPVKLSFESTGLVCEFNGPTQTSPALP